MSFKSHYLISARFLSFTDSIICGAIVHYQNLNLFGDISRNIFNYITDC